MPVTFVSCITIAVFMINVMIQFFWPLNEDLVISVIVFLDYNRRLDCAQVRAYLLAWIA